MVKIYFSIIPMKEPWATAPCAWRTYFDGLIAHKNPLATARASGRGILARRAVM